MVVQSGRSVRRLAVARLISLTGGAAAYMALNFTIYERICSAAWVAAAFDAVVHMGLAISYMVAGPAVELLGAKGVYVVGGAGALLGLAVAVPLLRGVAPVAVSVEVPAESVDSGEAQTLRVP